MTTLATPPVRASITSRSSYDACFDPADVAIANATCRSHGVVGGQNPVLPRIVATLAVRGVTRILDLGAGREALQADSLRRAGYLVSAIELGRNWTGVHDQDAWHQRFDVIYASNVLNVQASERMLHTTLRAATAFLADGGMFLANYPAAPRKLTWTDAQMLDVLAKHFGQVESLSRAERGGYSCRVMRCRTPIPHGSRWWDAA